MVKSSDGRRESPELTHWLLMEKGPRAGERDEGAGNHPGAHGGAKARFRVPQRWSQQVGKGVAMEGWDWGVQVTPRLFTFDD